MEHSQQHKRKYQTLQNKERHVTIHESQSDNDNQSKEDIIKYPTYKGNEQFIIKYLRKYLVK